MTLGVLLVSVAGFSGAWCSGDHGVYMFAVTRFLTGLGAMSCFMVSFVLMVESVSTKHTMMAGIGEMYFGYMLLSKLLKCTSYSHFLSCLNWHLCFAGINIPFAIGELVLGLEAYFVRDWRLLQMVAHGPLILFALVFWICPESVRWCLAKEFIWI